MVSLVQWVILYWVILMHNAQLESWMHAIAFSNTDTWCMHRFEPYCHAWCRASGHKLMPAQYTEPYCAITMSDAQHWGILMPHIYTPIKSWMHSMEPYWCHDAHPHWCLIHSIELYYWCLIYSIEPYWRLTHIDAWCTALSKPDTNSNARASLMLGRVLNACCSSK